jgi:hypothetical protein
VLNPNDKDEDFLIIELPDKSVFTYEIDSLKAHYPSEDHS